MFMFPIQDCRVTIHRNHDVWVWNLYLRHSISKPMSGFAKSFPIAFERAVGAFQRVGNASSGPSIVYYV